MTRRISLGFFPSANPNLVLFKLFLIDNLVEGKRRRRGATENTPTRSSSSSPRTPGPSGKRKLMGSEGSGTPAKRGRRGARAGTETRSPKP